MARPCDISLSRPLCYSLLLSRSKWFSLELVLRSGHCAQAARSLWTDYAAGSQWRRQRQRQQLRLKRWQNSAASTATATAIRARLVQKVPMPAKALQSLLAELLECFLGGQRPPAAQLTLPLPLSFPVTSRNYSELLWIWDAQWASINKYVCNFYRLQYVLTS